MENKDNNPNEPYTQNENQQQHSMASSTTAHDQYQRSELSRMRSAFQQSEQMSIEPSQQQQQSQDQNDDIILNNSNSQQMANPQVATGYQVYPISNDVVEQSKRNNQLPAEQKLKDMQKFVIKDQEYFGGCCDIIWIGCVVNSWSVKDSKFQRKDEFTINIAPPNVCKDESYGKFIAQEYSGEDSKEVELYEITHDRNCCFLKTLLGWAHIVGALWWLILNSICKPRGKIIKNGNIIATYELKGCCGKQIDVYNPQNQLKYRLKEQLTGDIIIQDINGQIVQNIEAEANYRRQHRGRSKTNSTIIFKSQIHPDEKAILIYAVAKLN